MSLSDDGIEIVEQVDSSHPANDDICQLCSTNLHGLTTAEHQEHYKQHDSRRQISARATKRVKPKHASAATSQRKATPMKPRKSIQDAAQDDVFWYPAQSEAPPDNYAPGVLSILKEALKQSHRKGATQRAVLCYERTPHIYRESFDTAWGCGYRNFLMTCAALMDQQSQTLYFPLLDDPSPPSVRNLQCWLEDAWKLGYDEVGARYFDHKLVETKKKIGTGDLYVAFTSRKIPCMLVDFNLRNSPKGFDTLIDWVVNYFTEKYEGDVTKVLLTTSPVVATGKMPVIMQYDGHSVTIVGYELAKNGKYNLLAFDPSSKVDKKIRQAALNAPNSVNWTSSSVSLGKSKRRDGSNSPTPKKRSRTNQDDDDGIVSIRDSDEENARRAVALESTLDPDTVIKAFKLKGSKKKDDYQLLYFTMGNPLSDEEQGERKNVLSIAEC